MIANRDEDFVQFVIEDVNARKREEEAFFRLLAGHEDGS